VLQTRDAEKILLSQHFVHVCAFALALEVFALHTHEIWGTLKNCYRILLVGYTNIDRRTVVAPGVTPTGGHRSPTGGLR